MKIFEWHKSKSNTRWHYWPIKLGWIRNSCHALICWHGWPIDGSRQKPDATATDCGWTIHIGAFKIKFGYINSKK